MAPPPRCSSSGISYFMDRNTPRRLTARTRSQSSSVMSAAGRAGLLDAGVVEGHVQPAEGVDRRVQGGLDVFGAGDVAAHGDGLAAGLLDQACRLGVGLLVDVGDHHAGALTGERLGGGAADACGGSGDEGDLAGEAVPVGAGHGGVPFSRCRGS